jgi:hypothetical protein
MGEAGGIFERAELSITVAFANDRQCGKADGQAEEQREEGTYQVKDPIRGGF